MRQWLFWLLVGALIGLGVVSILSIGIILLAAGIALLVFGVVRAGAARLWVGVVGFGLAPALLLIWDVTSQPWACEPANHIVVSGPVAPGGSSTSASYFQCVQTPVGLLTTYHVLAAGFLGIALVGLLLGLAVALRARGSQTSGGMRPA